MFREDKSLTSYDVTGLVSMTDWINSCLAQNIRSHFLSDFTASIHLFSPDLQTIIIGLIGLITWQPAGYYCSTLVRYK